MGDSELLERIVTNPEILGGKPILKGKRLAVAHVMAMLKGGAEQQEILDAFPFLTDDDIKACQIYAGQKKPGGVQ